MAKPDLNLMAVLEAVYDKENTSKAGETLLLSQSAVSHALARLRDIYQDPLFIRHGHKMLPTPLTKRIIKQVKRGLKDIRSSLDDAHNFNALKHKQTFIIGMRDALETGLLPPLISQLSQSAPLIRLQSQQILPCNIESHLDANKLDLCLELLEPVSSNICHALVCKGALVVIGRKSHPALQQAITLDNFLNHKHILLTTLEQEPDMIDIALSHIGLHRDIILRCQNPISAIRILLQSDHLSIVTKAYAKVISEFMPITYQEAPFNLPSLEGHLYWHERNDTDPAHIWLRQQVVKTLDNIPSVEVMPKAMEWIERPPL